MIINPKIKTPKKLNIVVIPEVAEFQVVMARVE